MAHTNLLLWTQLVCTKRSQVRINVFLFQTHSWKLLMCTSKVHMGQLEPGMLAWTNAPCKQVLRLLLNFQI